MHIAWQKLFPDELTKCVLCVRGAPTYSWDVHWRWWFGQFRKILGVNVPSDDAFWGSLSVANLQRRVE